MICRCLHGSLVICCLQTPAQKSEQEIQEEEELQLALALSQSENEAKEKEVGPLTNTCSALVLLLNAYFMVDKKKITLLLQSNLNVIYYRIFNKIDKF